MVSWSPISPLPLHNSLDIRYEWSTPFSAGPRGTIRALRAAHLIHPHRPPPKTLDLDPLPPSTSPPVLRSAAFVRRAYHHKAESPAGLMDEQKKDPNVALWLLGAWRTQHEAPDTPAHFLLPNPFPVHSLYWPLTGLPLRHAFHSCKSSLVYATAMGFWLS